MSDRYLEKPLYHTQPHKKQTRETPINDQAVAIKQNLIAIPTFKANREPFIDQRLHRCNVQEIREHFFVTLFVLASTTTTRKSSKKHIFQHHEGDIHCQYGVDKRNVNEIIEETTYDCGIIIESTQRGG